LLRYGLLYTKVRTPFTVHIDKLRTHKTVNSSAGVLTVYKMAFVRHLRFVVGVLGPSAKRIGLLGVQILIRTNVVVSMIKYASLILLFWIENAY